MTAITLANIARDNPGVAIRYLDGVDLPAEEGSNWISLGLRCDGETVEIVVFTTANFYKCLRKVMNEVMPSVAGVPLN